MKQKEMFVTIDKSGRNYAHTNHQLFRGNKYNDTDQVVLADTG